MQAVGCVRSKGRRGPSAQKVDLPAPMTLQFCINCIYAAVLIMDIISIYLRRRGVGQKHHSEANEVCANLKTLYRLVYNLVTRSVYKSKSNVFMVCLVFNFYCLESFMTMGFLQRITVSTNQSFSAIQFTHCSLSFELWTNCILTSKQTRDW